MQYTNKKNNNKINSSDVVSESNSGIVISNKNCWKYISKKDIETIPSYEDKDYYTEEKIPEFEKDEKPQFFDIKDNKIKNAFTEKARYYFGIEKLRFNTFVANSVCGIESKPIDVKNCSYITVNFDVTENSLIECYIVDGVNETPIIPENISDGMIEEKLFFNTPLRFVPIEKEGILYENLLESNKNINILTYEDFETNEYIYKYKIDKNLAYYVPDNETIKLKFIIRVKNKEDRIKIENVTINKYGGKLEWN
jgi:hypothetical protein